MLRRRRGRISLDRGSIRRSAGRTACAECRWGAGYYAPRSHRLGLVEPASGEKTPTRRSVVSVRDPLKQMPGAITAWPRVRPESSALLNVRQVAGVEAIALRWTATAPSFVRRVDDADGCVHTLTTPVPEGVIPTLGLNLLVATVSSPLTWASNPRGGTITAPFLSNSPSDLAKVGVASWSLVSRPTAYPPSRAGKLRRGAGSNAVAVGVDDGTLVLAPLSVFGQTYVRSGTAPCGP